LIVGIFALAGGDEFRESYSAADRALLGLLPARTATIVILPTAAAAQRPDLAIANGVRHFSALAPQLQVEGVLVVDNASANDASLAARIASAAMVYLTGGDPGWLVRTLRGSEVLAAMGAVALHGGIIAGSSAGAMALGEQMRWHGGWEPALNQVPGIVVIPHHDDRPRRLNEVRAGLPDHLIVLGIPTNVNCMTRLSGDHAAGARAWQVLGSRPVTIYRASGIVQIQGGETFAL
jgi:cyanophycinase-like exopeptidase